MNPNGTWWNLQRCGQLPRTLSPVQNSLWRSQLKDMTKSGRSSRWPNHINKCNALLDFLKSKCLLVWSIALMYLKLMLHHRLPHNLLGHLNLCNHTSLIKSCSLRMSWSSCCYKYNAWLKYLIQPWYLYKYNISLYVYKSYITRTVKISLLPWTWGEPQKWSLL